MRSDQRRRARKRKRRKVLYFPLCKRDTLAQRLAENFDETLSLWSGPAQTDSEFQLDGVDFFLERKRRQSTNRWGKIVGEARAEHLHQVVFICCWVAPAERHVNSLG